MTPPPVNPATPLTAASPAVDGRDAPEPATATTTAAAPAQAAQPAVANEAGGPAAEADNVANERTIAERRAAKQARMEAARKSAAAPAAAAPKTPAKAAVYAVPPTVGPARMRRRHYGVIALFLLMVIVPVVVAGTYLYTRAAPQFESRLGFAIRTEEASTPFDILGALGGVSAASSKDTDILYEYIQSQELVSRVDGLLDLKAMYTRPGNDPVYALTDGSTIEDLVSYWKRMVRIYYESATGLIEVRVFAFTPGDAQAVARAVLDESGRMINNLSAVAREDTTRYAKDSLDQAVTRLSNARQSITRFRVMNQMVDPTADIAGQMGLLNTLNVQLAQSLIELDVLITTAPDTDPRVLQARRRIEVINSRIDEERAKLGVGGDVAGMAEKFGEYERLKVDLDFAEKAYLSALSAYDGAVTEAQRNSRYLAAYIEPTLAQAPTAPNKPVTMLIVAIISFFSWAIIVLVYYSLRDRR